MQFIKFPSFINHTDKDAPGLLDAWRANADLCDMKWFGSEKVDGTNFQLITNVTGAVVAGRREAILVPGDKFFGGWQDLVNTLTPAMKKLYEIIREKRPTVLQVHVYGEYFGSGIIPRVFYTTGKGYQAFDIMVLHDKTAPYLDTEIEWLSVTEASALLDMVGIPRVQHTVQGTLEECLAADIKFNSTVPTLLGQEHKGAGRNLCEGLVLRPDHTWFCRPRHGTLSRALPENEDELGYWHRVMLKKKNDGFAETGPAIKPVAGPKTKKWTSTAAEAAYVALLPMLTISRATSVRSKMTDTEAANRKGFAEALLRDAVKAMPSESDADLWHPLSEAEKTEASKELLIVAFKVVADFLKPPE